MSKRSKYSAEEKYQIIKAYTDGFNASEITSQYEIDHKTLRKWAY